MYYMLLSMSFPCRRNAYVRQGHKDCRENNQSPYGNYVVS
jgi:hypothetical protein